MERESIGARLTSRTSNGERGAQEQGRRKEKGIPTAATDAANSARTANTLARICGLGGWRCSKTVFACAFHASEFRGRHVDAAALADGAQKGDGQTDGLDQAIEIV